MYTTNNEKQGVVKTDWSQVEPIMLKSSPEIVDMINALSPDKNYPLYLVYFPYGMLKGDTKNSFLPTIDNRICTLSDPSLPKDLINDLGYGMYSSPFGMILDKSIEYYIEHDNKIIPYDIAEPGHIFHKSILLNNKASRNYSPNGLLNASAGARTSFMIPSVSNFNNILSLNTKLKCKIKTPRKSSEHGQLFKDICSSHKINSEWRTCVLYFSEKWINKLKKDKAWSELKYYILDQARTEGEFESKNVFYDIFYSYVQNKHNLKISSPYLTHTIYHLFKLALGKMPGYIPANTETCLPLKDIQQCLYAHYNIDQHPTVMVPKKYYFDKNDNPIYYSLQMPSMPNFSIKRNKRVSANKEIEAISLMLEDYLEEMKSETSILRGTIFEAMAKNINFSFYHNVPTLENLVNHSSLLAESDERFLFNTTNFEAKPFCYEGQFLRGCIKVSNNDK